MKKDFNKFKKQKQKQKLIDEINEIQNKRKRLVKAKAKTEIKQKQKPKPKPKPNPETKHKKIKTFDDYFQECIKKKSIPKDTPKYFRKALERVIKEYEKGIVLQKSALEEFAEMYVIKGVPGITAKQFLQEKAKQVKQFFMDNRDTKIKMILVCNLEHKMIE